MTEGCVAKEEILQAHTQLSRRGAGEGDFVKESLRKAKHS